MEFNIEDNINKISIRLLTPYQWGCGGEWLCYWWVSWGMEWETEVLEDLYGAKAESDLTKNQNSQVNNEQKNLLQLCIQNTSCVRIKTNAGRGKNNICLCCAHFYAILSRKNERENVFKNLNEMLMCSYRSDVAE